MAAEKQVRVAVAGFAVVAVALIFVVDVVLAQQEVLDGIGLDELEQSLPDLEGSILPQSQMDLDIAAVLVPQAEDCIHVILQLCGQHLIGTDIASVGKTVGRVVRKAQDLQSLLDRLFERLPFFTPGRGCSARCGYGHS